MTAPRPEAVVGPAVDDEATVLRAQVHARLLGLQLLTLDATVVIGRPDRGAAPAQRSALPSVSAPDQLPFPEATPADRPGLAQAAALLAQGDRRLAEARSIPLGTGGNGSGPATGGRRSPRRTPST